MSTPLRKCRKCGLEAWTLEDMERFKASPTSLYGRDGICKKCDNKRNKKYYGSNPKISKRRAESSRRWNLANPERVKIISARHRWKAWGIDPEKARIIYDSNDNCAICGLEVKGRNKHLDHNHRNKEIRGVLCHQCNIMIGMAQDNVEIFEKAIKYLSIIPDNLNCP